LILPHINSRAVDATGLELSAKQGLRIEPRRASRVRRTKTARFTPGFISEIMPA
jgi:hypothetical protein